MLWPPLGCCGPRCLQKLVRDLDCGKTRKFVMLYDRLRLIEAIAFAEEISQNSLPGARLLRSEKERQWHHDRFITTDLPCLPSIINLCILVPVCKD